MKDPDFAEALSELLKLRAENAKLRTVVGLVHERVRVAHRDWAPELRNALADLYSSPAEPSEDNTKEDER